MLATMVVHGGELPRLLSKSICQYIQAGFDGSMPAIDEVPDRNVRDSLNKVSNRIHLFDLYAKYLCQL